MKSRYFLRVVSLLALLISLVPVNTVGALPYADPPPVGMFQLPWDLGIAWVAIDGLDNGIRRPLNSSHHYTVGGAIDFAPHNNMKMGEDTSRFWVAAAASGTVIAKSFCHVKIDHSNGWTTEYQFLANVQVKVGDSVSRNQRLGIIADGFRQPFCPGSQDPNVPHVHFMLRPSLRDAALAGWEVNYLPVLNKTTFRKNDQTVGLFKPLLNVFDAQPTPTPTPQPTNTPGLTPSSTPTPVMSATPTLSGPYVSTTVDPASIQVGETALVTIRLNNVPSGGYLSAEFTCHYDPSLLEVSNITVANLFGTDPVTAMNGPQNGKFILAIAGSNGNKATIDGTVFTFNVKGLYPAQTLFGCDARVSDGSNVLTQLSSARAFLTILGSTPTPNLTPSTPTVLPSTCDRAEFIADVNIPPGTVMSPGAHFTKTWRLKNIGPCDWTTSYGLVFFSGEQMGAVSSTSFTQSVAVGQTVDISINMTAPNAPGSYRGYWMFRNSSGANFGIGPEAKEPWFVEIIVSGPTLPPSLTPTHPPSSSTPTPTTGGPGNSPTPSITPGGPTVTPTLTPSPTIPVGEWLSFTNNTYGFRFLYPPDGQIVQGGNDNSTRINLPFVPGTNLSQKYLQMTVVENMNPCRSPLATSSIPQTSETVVINGISFLKETGEDGTAGHINTWTAYSTMKDNACVSLDFVLRAANPGVFSTPPPLYDQAAEALVFGQIVSTYQWLEGPFTATPTPVESSTPTPSTPVGSPTPTTLPDGTLTGQVLAGKLVTVSLYNASDELVTSAAANPDGTFSLTAPAGTYTIAASASGFLRAEGSATIIEGGASTKPTITLLAGDIDGNDVIDQFDALTIGMNYNASTPSEADLNNDGVINVLDLELLAGSYRKAAPQDWN